MKTKLERLNLSKFKKHELSKESHNAVMGGAQGVTNSVITGQTNDYFNDSTMYYNKQKGQWLYPNGDVEKHLFVSQAPTVTATVNESFS